MRSKLLRLVLLFMAFALVGCFERKADLLKQEHYSNNGLAFDYPGNWSSTPTLDLAMSSVRLITIESPGDAVVFVFVYEDDETQLKEFAEDFASNAEDEIPLGGMMNSKMSNIAEADGYQQIKETVDMKLLGQSVPHTRLYGLKKFDDDTVILIFQVATEDLDETKGGYELIRRSLSLK